MQTRWPLALAALLGLLVPTRAAHATPAPRPRPVLFQGLRLSEGILVSRADTDMACTLGPEGAPRCRVQVSYTLENRTEAPIDGGGSLVVDAAAQDVAVTVDGVAASAWTNTVASPEDAGGAKPPAPATFALSIAAHGTRVLSVVARVDGVRTTGHLGLTPSAVHARHLLLHTPSVRSGLDVLVADPPTALQAPGFKGHARLRAPEGWKLDGVDGWTETPDGARAADVTELRVGLHVPAFPIRNGGVILGLGATLDEGTFRMRLGWEIAAPSWLLYQVSAETDARGRWTVAPLVLAASNALLLIPSFGFGLGLPVLVRPDTRLGARVQFEAQIFPLGVVASCDLFPKTSSAPGVAQWTLLVQLAL